MHFATSVHFAKRRRYVLTSGVVCRVQVKGNGQCQAGPSFGTLMKTRLQALWIVALMASFLASPTLAMECSRSIPAPKPWKCSAEDIETGTKGCSIADCSIELNGCEVDWPPLCSGIELILHKIFGWPRNTDPQPGDITAE